MNFVIKVADFGFSETIDPSHDYYRQMDLNSIKLPVKWMAPECLNDGKFSEKSDMVFDIKFYLVRMHTLMSYGYKHTVYTLHYACYSPVGLWSDLLGNFQLW